MTVRVLPFALFVHVFSLRLAGGIIDLGGDWSEQVEELLKLKLNKQLRIEFHEARMPHC